jgi:hypothetical protein
MSEMVCVRESVYRYALTRGQRYTVFAADDAKRQVRVKGNNGRTRWFPIYCFDQSTRSVPTLATFHLDDPISADDDLSIEVTVELSDGERRWCTFVTPDALASRGDWIDGTQIPFHYGNRHIVVARELSEDLIGRMLRYIDSQGELAQCTLPLEPVDDPEEAS